MKPALTSVRVDRAIDEAAKAFEVPHREILSYLRTPSITRARLALYAALYDTCETSYPELARHLKRDHSTLIWGVKKAHALAALDTGYAAAMAKITAVL